ncbi:MAG: methylated-DNA--[protein]-cysteine S-methyltransferase [Muribaculaceae bacterium]|nr:methylated-DNA--[protein]-cysteine S-methyltransferase [Muribaculaceae bacterium]
MEIIKITHHTTPFGEMIIGSHEDKICLCDWAVRQDRAAQDRRILSRLNGRYESGMSEVINETLAQLKEYFEGKRTAFYIPLQLVGTEFQRLVWSRLMEIPYGHTISYADVAARIGNPKAIRAAASAIAANPISIIIPCHRVVGSDNRLTGYAGGIDAKKALLDLETHTCGKALSSYVRP